MRVLLAGGSGFIGGHILQALVERGHQVTCLARGRGRRRIDAMALPGVKTVEGDYTSNEPAPWIGSLGEHDVLINAVGIIRQTRTARFDMVHTFAPLVLFALAEKAGISKIVQISALGADENAQSEYHLSKRAADESLIESGMRCVVLRPSLVYGPGDHSMTFFESLAALPIVPVPGDGEFKVQPVHIDDLVMAVLQSVKGDDVPKVIDIVGPRPIPFNEVLDILARRLGKPRARKWHVPWCLMRVVARFTDVFGVGPITSEELSMLRRGNEAPSEAMSKAFGFEPIAFETGLARKPLTRADQWHARLALLRLPLRLSIAFVWLWTGYVSALPSASLGLSLLEDVGIQGRTAAWLMYGTSGFEIALGLATAAGWRPRLLGAVQLGLIAAFTAILSIATPELWLHPFGPLTKNIPLIFATLVMIALEDESRP